MKSYKKEVQPSKIIEARRTELSLTQVELATRLGYDNANNISMIEAGKSKVPLNRAHEFARVLEMDDPERFIKIVMSERFPDLAEYIFS